MTAFGVALAGMNCSFYAAISRLPLGVAVSIEFLGPLVLAAVLSRPQADLIWVGLAMAAMVLLGVEGHTMSYTSSVAHTSSMGRETPRMFCAARCPDIRAAVTVAGSSVQVASPARCSDPSPTGVASTS